MDNRRLVTVLLVASLALGAGSGVISSILITQALDNYAAALLGDRGFAAFEPRKPDSDESGDALNRVRTEAERSLALIMPAREPSAFPSGWLTADDVIGLGVVVGSNGWVLTTESELVITNALVQARVWVRGVDYQIAEIVRDPLTSYVLLRLADATGLSSIGFAATEETLSGEQFYLVGSFGAVTPASVVNNESTVLAGLPGATAAELYSRGWLLVERSASGPLFTGNGDLAGFASSTMGYAEPIHYAGPFVEEILRTGQSQIAGLGAMTADLGYAVNVRDELRKNRSTGALVVTVVRVGPAASAGLLPDDIVVAVDGEAITLTTSLSELLATYDPGQSARLTVVRDNETVDLTVELGDYSDLLY